MDDSKNKLLEKIKASNAILITVSNNPTVDQLSACIAFALLFNKLNKTGSALYSGQTPSTIEFLKPEQTLEKNTDSLQDFIISLDKNKADKLRTKVDEQSVKIFITPYKTSLTENDLEFSQGDFNVDLIIALGVYKKEELDAAITNHGGILHDATIATVTINDPSELGSINVNDSRVSSFCELTAILSKSLGNNLIDEQIATALLTGIVAETDRFSNDKTTPQTMSTSSELMVAGANPKLIASELGVSTSIPSSDNTISVTGANSNEPETLNIDHDLDELLGEEDQDQDQDQAEDLQALSSDSSETEQDQDLTTNELIDQTPSQSNIEQSSSNSIVSKYPEKPDQADSFKDALNQISNNTPNQDMGKNNDNIEELTAYVPPAQDQGAQAIKPLDDIVSDQVISNPTEPSINVQNQSFTPPPPDWQPPKSPSLDTTYPAISTNHNNNELTGDEPNLMLNEARNGVESALGDQEEMPSGAPQNSPAGDITPPNSSNLESSDSNAVNQATVPENPTTNQTGLDPSLFSEPEKREYDNSKAPPVPPPVVQLPFNNNDQSSSSR